MNPRKATGIDGISARFLRDFSAELVPPLTLIFNYSIKKGIYPFLLKHALVSPIYKKKGSKLDVSNYRPISVLPAIAKVFDSIVCKHLTLFLESTQFFSPNQHGFRRDHSTQSAAAAFTTPIFKSADLRKYTGAVFVDFKKAFDYVNHDILLCKLSKAKVKGPLLEWFKSYLQNRTITVRNGDTSSKPTLLKASVPQGSNLAPVLFSIYINDLPEYLENCHGEMFADDVGAATNGKNKNEVESKLNKDMILISK